MKHMFFLLIILALALIAVPLGMATAQADSSANQQLQISRAKLPPGMEKSVAEARTARFSPPRAGLDKAEWSRSLSTSTEELYQEQTAVFKGHLYVGIMRFTDTGEGAQIFRTADGETWEAAIEPAFGNELEPDQFNSTYFQHLFVFKDHLYAGLGWWVTDNATFWYPKGGQMWRTADGINWEKVLDLSGDPWNEQVSAYAEFQGQLYAATTNWDNGFELWRSPSGDAGDWTKVADNSLGTFSPAGGCRLDVFNNTLLVIPWGWMNQDYSSGPVHLWTSRDGLSYDLVTDDGFGDPNALYSSNYMGYKGDYYIQLSIIDPETSAERQRLMVTHDGVSWSQYCDNCLGLGTVYKGYVYNIWDAGRAVFRSADLLNWEQLDWEAIDDPSITNEYGPLTVFKGEIYVVAYREANQVDLWRLAVGGK
jgi:hypothetical protein